MSETARMRRPAALLAGAGALAAVVALGAVAPTEARFLDAGGAQASVAARHALEVSFVQVSAGVDFSLALSEDGRVFGWGLNDSGQLGLGADTANRDVPVAVALPAGERFTAISAGRYVAMALSESGVVYTWGGGAPAGGVPTAVAGLPAPAVGVSAGGQFFLAWTEDGRLFSWGNNDAGRLGRGQAGVTDPVPAQVTAAGVAGGILGADAGRAGAVAWSESGAVYAWGELQAGAAGVTMGGVPTGTVLKAVQGEQTKMLLMDSGLLYFSRGTAAFRVQTDISGVVDVTAAVAGSYDSQTYLALTGDGGYFAWLDNSSGQYGDGTLTVSAIPRPVTTSAVAPEGILSVAAGDTHSLLLTASGRLLTTGADEFGQLGNGALPATTTLAALPPVLIWP